MPRLPKVSLLSEAKPPVWKGYAYAPASEKASSLAITWPNALHVSCVSPPGDMNKLNIKTIDYFVFKPKSRHAFLKDLWSSQQFAVIKLPPFQLLVLYVPYEDCWQLNGMLFWKRLSSTIKESLKISDITTQGNQQHQEVQQADGTYQLMQPVSQPSCRNFMSLEGMFMPQMPMSLLSAVQPVWTGCLFVAVPGRKTLLLPELEGYTYGTASENLAADWPDKLHVVGAMPLLDMNKMNTEKVDYLIFKPKALHAFFKDMWSKQAWAVVKLPSQTMFICVAGGKEVHLRGLVFPQGAVVWLHELEASDRDTATITSSSTRADPEQIFAQKQQKVS